MEDSRWVFAFCIFWIERTQLFLAVSKSRPFTILMKEKKIAMKNILNTEGIFEYQYRREITLRKKPYFISDYGKIQETLNREWCDHRSTKSLKNAESV